MSNVETLLVVYQLLAALISIVIVGSAWYSRGRYGLWFWAGSFFFIWATLFAKGLAASMTGSQRFGLFFGHSGAVLAALSLLLATRNYLGELPRWRSVAIIAVIGELGSAAVLFTGLRPWMSLSLTLCIGSAFCFMALLSLHRAYRRDGGFALALISVVVSVKAAANLARAVMISPLVGDSLAMVNSNIVWMIIFICLLVMEALAVLVLISDSLRREILVLAEFDPLTGLLNRRGFAARFARIVQRNGVGKADVPLALAIIDVDHFKSINDTYGHAVGDDILCGLGKHLESQIRPTDIAGRLGGEEFVIVWVGPSDLNPRAAAERLRQHIADSPLATRAEPLKSTVSIGVVGVRHGDDDLDRLLDRADLALYESKAAGRNLVTVSEATEAT